MKTESQEKSFSQLIVRKIGIKKAFPWIAKGGGKRLVGASVEDTPKILKIIFCDQWLQKRIKHLGRCVINFVIGEAPEVGLGGLEIAMPKHLRDDFNADT